jgi:hypothetical protein
MKKDLVTTVNPAAIGRSHPLISVGAALAGGTALGLLLGKRRTHEAPRRPSPPPQAYFYAAPPPQKRRSLTTVLLRQAIRAVGPIITALARQAISSMHAPAASSNGHSPPETNVEVGPPPT